MLLAVDGRLRPGESNVYWALHAFSLGRNIFQACQTESCFYPGEVGEAEGARGRLVVASRVVTRLGSA